MNKILETLGRLFFSLPLVVMGLGHFSNPQAMAPMVPSYLPAPLFWVYLVGVALFAAALSFNLRKHDRLAGLLTALMLVGFAVLIHLPGLRAAGNDMAKMMSMVNFFKDLGLAGGALLLAAASKARA